MVKNNFKYFLKLHQQVFPCTNIKTNKILKYIQDF